MQLLNIQEHKDMIQAVDAKELYEALGLNMAHWSRWRIANIVNNPFTLEGEDYEGFTMMVSGNKTINYLLSIDLAKKLAMQVRTEMGERVRDYFLECERQAKQSVMPALPDFTNPAEAARAFADQYEAKQIAQAQVAELQPKADALDTLSHADGSLGIRETAKAVGIPEREFIARCLDDSKPLSSRFLYRDNAGKLKAHAHRIKQGFMTQKISSYKSRSGRDVVSVQVKFTPAGVTHVAKRMQVKKSGGAK